MEVNGHRVEPVMAEEWVVAEMVVAEMGVAAWAVAILEARTVVAAAGQACLMAQS